jgi:ribosomal protein S18 acetylase RimI-like enzyme
MTSVALTTDIGADLAHFLELEREASRPYGAFVYGTDALHATVHEDLLEGGAAEFSPPEGRLAVVDDQVVGMMAALSGATLKRRRLQAAYRIARSAFTVLDPDLPSRIRLAARTLLQPRDDDVYVSRIAVAPAARRRGVAAAMLEAILEEARAVGAPRCVLEVAPENAAAVALYERHGFVRAALRSVTEPRTGRALSYFHMVCTRGA